MDSLSFFMGSSQGGVALLLFVVDRRPCWWHLGGRVFQGFARLDGWQLGFL